MKNKFKSFCIAFFSLTLAAVVLVSAIVFVIDPFTHYRAPADYTKIIYQLPYYQNIGIARQADFDTLITGTSMVQNFRGSWFDERFGCKAIRLGFDGGCMEDFDILLDTALQTGKIKTVYWGIDNYLFTDDTELHKETRIPDYLADGVGLNDVNYLLNKDVLLRYVPVFFSYKRLPDYDFHEMQAWDVRDYTFSKSAVLSGYERIKQQKLREESYFEQTAVEHAAVILRHASENPNTEFVLFAPPYSILYWDDQQLAGTLDATLSALKTVYSQLIEQPNVRLFYFQNRQDIVLNLDNYKDSTHYKTDINRFMLDCFENGECRITAANLNSTLASMKETVASFEFEALLS